MTDTYTHKFTQSVSLFFLLLYIYILSLFYVEKEKKEQKQKRYPLGWFSFSRYFIQVTSKETKSKFYAYRLEMHFPSFTSSSSSLSFFSFFPWSIQKKTLRATLSTPTLVRLDIHIALFSVPEKNKNKDFAKAYSLSSTQFYTFRIETEKRERENKSENEQKFVGARKV